MHKYHAFYFGRKTDLSAESLYQAKVAAIDYFKPPRRSQHMVSVVLFEKGDGTPVSLFNSNADLG